MQADMFQWMESPNWQILHPKNKNRLTNTDNLILQHIKQENEYTNQKLKSTNKDKIFNQIWKTIPVKNRSIIMIRSGIIYYSKFNKNREYPIIQLQKFKMRKTRKITIIDFNKYAQNYKFYKVDGVSISPRDRILSYAVDTSGNHKYTRYFYDVNKRQHYTLNLVGIPGNIHWLLNSVLYHTYNEVMRANKIFLLTFCDIRQNRKAPKLIYEEKCDNVYISISQSTDRKFVFLHRSISDSNEIFIAKNNNLSQDTKWYGLLPMRSQIMYTLYTNTRGFFIVINDISLQYRILFIDKKDIDKLFCDDALMIDLSNDSSNEHTSKKSDSLNNTADAKEGINSDSNTSDISRIAQKQLNLFYQYAREIVKPNDKLEIESIALTNDIMSINYIDKQGLPVIKLFHLDDVQQQMYDVPLLNNVSTAYSYVNDKNNNDIYYSYQSLNCPVKVYRIKKLSRLTRLIANKSLNSNQNTDGKSIKSDAQNQDSKTTSVEYKKSLCKIDDFHIKTDVVYRSKYKFDEKKYVVKRIYVPNGNINIPVTIIYKKDISSNAKLLLHGYGAYGISYDLFFDNNRKYLLDTGWIIGYAHVRGGGELGDKWYYDGYMLNKKNTFNDFSMVISYLIKENYTSYDRMCIIGGSAGGLVVGNAIIDHPQLKAAIFLVPFLTPLYTMMNGDLPLTPGEYTEWGNPAKCQKIYDYIKSYDPYLRLLDFFQKKGLNCDVDDHKSLVALREEENNGNLSKDNTDIDKKNYKSSKNADNNHDLSILNQFLDRYKEVYGYDNRNNESNSSNTHERTLPNIYISGAISDPLVTYWEPLKYISLIREWQKYQLNHNKKLDLQVAFLNMEINTSHRGKTGIKQPIYDIIKRIDFMEKMVK